ncbi:hypothetical protein [Acidocella sp.]|uniref:hypothetical protein n=1 Tax=Acidocella sp. TaxID=50710 RepID=UPI003CFC8717
MYDQNIEPISSVVPHIMSAATAGNERLLQSNLSNAPLIQPQVVSEDGSAAVEQAAVKAYNCDAYASCVASAQLPYESEKEAMRHRYAHLQKVALTIGHPRFDLIEFVKAAGKKPTKATQASPYQKVIQLTDTGISKDAASKRGAALGWVLTQCGSASGVAEYFEKNGGISKCYDAALQARREQEASTRSQPPRGRARSNDVARPPSIPVTGLPVGVNGEFTFLIRLTDGFGEVIATVSADTGDQEAVRPTSQSAPSEVANPSATPSSDESDDGASTANLTDSVGEQKTTTEAIPQSPVEPEPEQASGAGDAADSAVQVQIDETEDEKEQV